MLPNFVSYHTNPSHLILSQCHLTTHKNHATSAKTAANPPIETCTELPALGLYGEGVPETKGKPVPVGTGTITVDVETAYGTEVPALDPTGTTAALEAEGDTTTALEAAGDTATALVAGDDTATALDAGDDTTTAVVAGGAAVAEARVSVMRFVMVRTVA